jgi:hypothetical protein
MTPTTSIKQVAKTTVLCTALIVANAVWSKDCPEGAGAANATDLDVSQAQTLSAADLYELFHSADLNQSDDLGDYMEDYHADNLR